MPLPNLAAPRALLAALALLAVAPAALAQADLAQRLAPGQPPLVIAHRSAQMGGTPENALARLDHAIAQGIEIVHVNPQITADGRYILMHDPTLNRTTDVENVYRDGPPDGPSRAARGGKDFVRDYTLDQIRRLALTDAADGAPHPVPTLEEALDRARGRLVLQLGLKSHETESLARAFAGADPGRVILFELVYPGTDQTALRDLARATGLPVGVALLQTRDPLRDLEHVAAQLGPALRMVNIGSARLGPAFLDRARALGLHVSVSGWNGPEDAALLRGDPAPWEAIRDLGLSALTDQPDRVRALYTAGP